MLRRRTGLPILILRYIDKSSDQNTSLMDKTLGDDLTHYLIVAFTKSSSQILKVVDFVKIKLHEIRAFLGLELNNKEFC